MTCLRPTLSTIAVRIPPMHPGTENIKLLIVIIVVRYGFLKPKALSIPYS